MRSAKFFRWIWRLNAILILLVAAAALFAVIGVFVSEMRASAERRKVADAAPPVAPAAEKKELRLGGLMPIEGTSVMRADLTLPAGEANYSSGRLLLFDPAAKHVNEIAGGVHDVDGVTLMPSGAIAVLYESNRRYHLATFDRASLARISERDVNVPQLR